MKKLEIKVNCSECDEQQAVRVVIGQPQTIVCFVCGTTYGLEVAEIESKEDGDSFNV